MGIHVIKMPDIGEGIAEVELVEWHVKPGDMVTEDQSLADVMTDKASVEIPAPVAGRVLELGGKPGDVMAVGSELIRIEVEGDGNVAAAAPGTSSASASPVKPVPVTAPATAGETKAASEPEKSAATDPAAAPPAMAVPERTAKTKPHIPAKAASKIAKPAATKAAANDPGGDKPFAAPAVRRRASALGIDLHAVSGSGPGGRVTHEDLDALAARSGGAQPGTAPRQEQEPESWSESRPAPVTGAQYAERNNEENVAIIGLRRKIAQKMQESKRRIPHFTYVEEVDVTEIEALRGKLNGQWSTQRGKLTLLPFLMRAIVRATPLFPQINARYDDDNSTLTRYGAVHIGIATQTEGGLMVPVVRHAEGRDLWSCATEVARLAEAARTGKATRDELTGSTITITSLGALGGIVTTPVINYPEVAIVGVNRMVERPVIRNGAIVPRLMMNLSSSFDHRVVDGMLGAEFVQALRGISSILRRCSSNSAVLQSFPGAIERSACLSTGHRQEARNKPDDQHGIASPMPSVPGYSSPAPMLATLPSAPSYA
jgi:2-oxoisovalerate dehydrogenase E2 component (dihydrolipoyl transacylase)